METTNVTAMTEALGLDRQAIEALLDEQQIHLKNLAQIGQRSVATWNYVINDEVQRHRKYLEEIFLSAQRRTQGGLDDRG